MKNRINRRNFLKSAAIAASAFSAAGAKAAGNPRSASRGLQGTPIMEKRRVLGSGKAAMEVSAMGLGCMGMSANHGLPRDQKAMANLIAEAVDLGVTSSTPRKSTGRTRTRSSSAKPSHPTATAC